MNRLLLVVALSACRDKAEPPAPAPAPPAPAPAPAPARKTGPAPVLHGSGVDPSGMPADQAFAAEQPDPDWTIRTEKLLHDKLPGAQIECKTTICEVRGDGMKLDAQLQQLRDTAQSVLLTGGGSGETRAYVKFDR